MTKLRGCIGAVVMSALLLSALAGARPAVAQDDFRLSAVDRFVAIGDVHGAYEAFARILRRAELIDDAGRWTGGETQLIIVGDVLDRGPDSRLALDLIMRLAGEAATEGGGVQFVLGNHEIMNMTGDLRYVAPAEFAAFATDEPAAIREAEFARFLESQAAGIDADNARRMFDAAYPPGFFAHREAFSPRGVYGRWLRTRPVLLVVNDFAFVHGGLSAALADNATRLNAVMSEALNAYVDGTDALVSAGLLSRTMEFYDVPAFAADLLERAADGTVDLTPALQEAAQVAAAVESTPLYVPDGPVWYRGNVSCNRLTEQDRLSAALDTLGVSHLVVGHTPTPDARILTRMQDRVLRVDTGMLNEYYGGRASALIVEGNNTSVLYEDESSPSAPIEQPRRVGVRPAGMSAEMLEEVLMRAEIVARSPLDATASLVELRDGDLGLTALFTPIERGSSQPAVAAYRLDRLLALDMVPVTVPREVEGVSGALQFLPERSISEIERSQNGLGGSAWCPLGDQLKDMYLFDSLIFNRARTPDRLRYSTEDFQVLLMGHNLTFSTDRGRPDYQRDLPVELTPAWRQALANLDEDSLAAAVGDSLDRRQIRAVLARRDHLLELAD